jgi:hypothetical protein
MLILSIGWVVFVSCNQSKSGLDKASLMNHYKSPEDSLKRKAVTFLLENISGQTSQIPDTEKTVHSVRIVSDTLLVDNEFLIRNIEEAFQLWNKYPWSKRVPETIFMNYLLPYKVYGEEPSEWRRFFFAKYEDSVRTFVREAETNIRYESANDVYYRICCDEVNNWYKYDPNPVRNTVYPGMKELLEKDGHDCVGWAYLTVSKKKIKKILAY